MIGRVTDFGWVRLPNAKYHDHDSDRLRLLETARRDRTPWRGEGC